MDDADVLLWLQPLLTAPYVWRETGSAGGIRATTLLRDKEGRPIQYLNLVTALAAARGLAFHSAEYKSAAIAIRMPLDLASAMSRADDNNLPKSHEYSKILTALVGFIANGGNL